MSAKKKKHPLFSREWWTENIKIFLSAYLIAFVIRLFIIEAYQIPSQSMVPSLLVNDTLMVQKFTLGAYVPVGWWKIPGITKPRRNDIVVFVTPDWKSPGKFKELISLLTLSLVNLDNTFDHPKNLVKRLVAEPGDTLAMTNRMLVLNGKPVPMDYLTTEQQPILDRKQLEAYRPFDLFRETVDGKSRIVQHLNGHNYQFQAEVYDIPEIKVPKKDDVIQLGSINPYYLKLVKMMIERETGKSFGNQNNSFILDGKPLTEWKVTQNYYFCMGDNRDASYDCRYFGFIPERNFYGKPLFRYWPFTRAALDVNRKI